MIETRRLLIQELTLSQTQLAVLEQQLQQQRLRYAMQDSSEGVALLERERIKRQVRPFMFQTMIIFSNEVFFLET